MPFAAKYAAALAVMSFSAAGAVPAAPWNLARNANFEVYSHESADAARSALQWFDRLRALVVGQTGLKLETRHPIRVIAFGSVADYEPFRLAPTSDAYYLGSESRDYIVLPTLDGSGFRTAAHEYAHFVLRASGLRLPPWLDEGIADLFSTVHIDVGGAKIGGELAGRLEVLRRRPWMPMEQLLSLPRDSPLRNDRRASDAFYAQSWALTEMLALAPAYRPRFHLLLMGLASGEPASTAFQAVYGQSVDGIARELHLWVDRASAKPVAIEAPAAAAAAAAAEVTQVPPAAMQLILADMLLAGRQLDRAEALYRDLSRESPGMPEVSAGLGAVALARGEAAEARRLWKRALDAGLRDAALCYRYAALLDQAGITGDELRSALERTVALDPDFDDARYKLALLEANASRYEAALMQFHAIRHVAPDRAFDYWCAMADALIGLGRGEEAQAAARHAQEHAVTAQERSRAAQLAFIARSHIAVQFARDENGNTRLVTTRVPDDAGDFNPFVEPGDDIRVARGSLRNIDCHKGALRISVETAEGVVIVSIPDPSHVQMKNAPPEFTCGPQPPAVVAVQYDATRKIVRGIEFLKP